MSHDYLPDGSLRISEHWRLLRAICATAAVLLPATVLWAASMEGSITWRTLGGALLGLLLPGGVAFLVADHRFVFNPATRILTWEIASWARRRGGDMPFDDITGAVVSASIESDDHSARRRPHYTTLLVTRSGALPLTATRGLHKPDYDALAAQVLAIVGLPGPDSNAQVQQLVAAGDIAAAITLLRATRGLDLTTAQAVVESMRPSPPAG